MNAPDPMLRALAAAHDSLLAPFGLDEAALARAVGNSPVTEAP